MESALVISLSELKTKSEESRVDISVLERDYVISWVLKGIYDNPVLKDGLVFKGGTALRKTYFPNYRFSEDLDFTTIRPLSELSGAKIKENLEIICGNVYQESGIELKIVDFKQTRNEFGEEAFVGKVQYIGPREHRIGSLPRIKLDITFFEKVFLKPNKVSLIHLYSDKSDCQAKVSVYRLEEILAEKLRSILQRQRSRDIYDIWSLLKFNKDEFKLDTVEELFAKKCDYKKVTFKSLDDFLNPELLESHRLAWEPSIRRQVVNLPSFKEVEDDLRVFLMELF